MTQSFEQFPTPETLHAERALHALHIPRFSTIPQRSDRHVVIPDLHGEHKVADEIIDRYIDREDVTFVFLGDLVDRKGPTPDPEHGVYKTLNAVKSLGERAVVTIANHEWTLLAALLAQNPRQKELAQRLYFSSETIDRQERNVLSAYGVERTMPPSPTATWLHHAMRRAGHLAVLQAATPYYETDQFIAVHAGLNPNDSWENQREYLEDVAEAMSEGTYSERPPQWFSQDYATSLTSLERATAKKVVSGHAHQLVNTRRRRQTNYSSERALHNEKRIRLASRLNAPRRESAYVWQDWGDERIIEIKRTPDN